MILNSVISDLPVGLIVTVFLGVITVLALGLGVIFGFKRNAAMTVVRFVFLAVAIVLAAFCATVFAVLVLDKNSAQICNALESISDNKEFIESLREYMASGSTAVRDVQKLIVAIAAPVIFACVFFVVNIILLIIYAIVTACTCSVGHRKRVAKRRQRKGEESTYKNKCAWWVRLILVLSNVVMSFVIAICIILPVTYYLNLASDVAERAADLIDTVSSTDTAEEGESLSTASAALTSSESDGSLDSAIELLSEINSNPLMKVYGPVSELAAAPITMLHGQTVHDMLVGSLPAVSEVWTDFKNLNIDTGNLTEETIDEIAEIMNNASDCLKSSAIIDNIVGGLLCDAAAYWENEQPFLTIDIYEMLGAGSAEGSDGESFDLKPVVKVVCEVLADKEKPLASDKLGLVGDIIGPAGGIMPAISALSNVGGLDGIKNLDKQTLSAINAVAEEYSRNEYADEKFGEIILTVMGSSTLGLPEEYGQVLSAVKSSFDNGKRTASSVLNLLGDTLIVTVDLVNTVGTDSDGISAIADSVDAAAAILEDSQDVDALYSNVIINSYNVLPLPEQYNAAMNTFIGAVKENEGQYTTGSSILRLFGKVLLTINDIAEIEFDDVSAEKFYELAADSAKDGEADVISGLILSEAAETWRGGNNYCGVSDPVEGSKFADGIYTVLINKPGEKVAASDKFTAAGNVVKLSNIVLGAYILQNDAEAEPINTLEEVKSLVDNLNEQSADIVKETLSDNLIASVIEGEITNIKNDAQSTAAVSAAVAELVDGLLNLKTDESKSAEEAEREQKAVADLFEAINDADNMDEENATALIESVKDSEIVKSAVAALIVEDASGNKSSAIEAEVSADTKTHIENALNDAGVDEEYRQNILLIFSVNG